MRNHEVIDSHDLLDQQGSLIEPGWSRQLIQIYDRSKIKASSLRIKEWDYYLVLHDDYGCAFTISDNGYIGLQSVSFLDFKRGWEHTNTILNPLPLGNMHMPSSSESGNVQFHNKKLTLDFIKDGNTRHIRCYFKEFYDHQDFQCDLKLYQNDMDTMVIATPWKEKKNAFYYNQKINCMSAEGYIKFQGKTMVFDSKKNFGTLDWGRGVWTYDNTWYWSNGNAIIDGKPFGFNIGYGFGDTSAASENIVYYDGKSHKLDDVTFQVPEDDYMKPWKITSSDQRFEMDFDPILDRKAKISAVVISSDQHQVFGKMHGFVILDDGTKLQVDEILCFAEVVHNRY